MITRVLLDYLRLGSLPVYDVEWTPNYGWGVFHVLDFADPLAQYEMDGQWRTVHGHPRIVIPLTIDADLVECQRQVPRWIETAQQFPGDGTLIFCIRTSAPIPGTTAHYVCAGMAYVPQQLGNATVLEGEDPAELVLHVLQGHRDHPMVRTLLERRDAEAVEHERYWAMAEAAQAVERKKNHAAFKRAARLLHGCLTPKQRRELRKKNHIHVNGQDGRLYRIEARSHQNVFLIQEGEPTWQYCVVSREQVPVPDLMLAQKLLLETSIQDFMDLANKWDLKGPSGQRRRVIPVEYWENPDNFRHLPPVDPHIPELPPLPNVAYANVGRLENLEMDLDQLDVAV